MCQTLMSDRGLQGESKSTEEKNFGHWLRRYRVFYTFGHNFLKAILLERFDVTGWNSCIVFLCWYFINCHNRWGKNPGPYLEKLFLRFSVKKYIFWVDFRKNITIFGKLKKNATKMSIQFWRHTWSLPAKKCKKSQMENHGDHFSWHVFDRWKEIHQWN